jgi:hypothetical protein
VRPSWYPNQSIKVYATFERTTFAGGATRQPENVVFYRTQLGFWLRSTFCALRLTLYRGSTVTTTASDVVDAPALSMATAVSL